MPIAETVEVKDANGAIREVRTLPATFPVSGPFLTETQLRAAPVAIAGALTDGELRAAAVPVSLASVPAHAVTQGGPWIVSQGDVWTVSLQSVPTHGVTQSGAWSVSISGTVAVTGPLTDTQLRAAPLAVTGTFFQATQPVSGPLTDAQLRASAVPVSGFPAWPYPATVTRVAQQSANLANAQGTATLAAAVGKTTYLTSLQIFATGATAAGAFSVTITGLLGGTMTIPFDVPAGVNLRATPLILEFALPLPASAVNTAIVVTLPALGSGNTRATVNAQGFQQ